MELVTVVLLVLYMITGVGIVCYMDLVTTIGLVLYRIGDS